MVERIISRGRMEWLIYSSFHFGTLQVAFWGSTRCSVERFEDFIRSDFVEIYFQSYAKMAEK